MGQGELCRRRDACRLCGSSDVATVLTLTPTPPANAFVGPSRRNEKQVAYPLEVGFCRECTHVQLMHVVDASHLFTDYVYVSGTSPVFVRHFDKYSEAVLARVCLSPGDLVVEVGSNDGTLLRAFQDRGMNVLGVDPARDIAGRASDAGVETWPRFFDASVAAEIRDTRGSAKCVAANNVLAHIDALSETIDAAVDLLAPDGMLVFEVSYLADVIEKTLFDTIYHEHLDYHTVAPLVGFLRRSGLELVHVEHVDTHGGSLRGYARKADGPHPVSGAVEEFVARERALGLDREETFIEFGKTIDVLGTRVRDFLEGLRGKGKQIAGFGAPAKATTLMHQFRLGPNMIEYIVDDNQWKQGLFTPGLHIPVLAPDSIYSLRPDFLVILAWNFSEIIIRNHSAYRDSGGKFVVPVPSLTVH